MLVALSCSKNEPEATAVETAAVAAEPPTQPTPVEPGASAQAAVSAEPEAVKTQVADEVIAADEKVSPKKAVKPAPEAKQPAPVASVPKDAPKNDGYTGPNPCRAKKFSFSSVKNACNKGGVAQAKELMKGYTKKGKDQGKGWKCSTCHDNTKTYTNKSNAVQDLKSIF